jgi:hypothetical protein
MGHPFLVAMFARFTRCWPCIIVLAAAACAEDSAGDELEDMADMEEAPTPLPEPDARGTYLDVYLSDGARICQPTLERLDDEVERIAEALGVSPDPEDRIALHYGDWAVKELCDIEYEIGEFIGGGCADDDGLWIAAQPGAESHEIVHTLRIRRGLFGPPYWEEGLATYLGTWRPYAEFSVWASGDLQPSQSLRSSEYPDQAGYTESAHFITFIDQAYGSDTVRALSRSLGEDTEPGTAFEQALGVSLETVEERWKTESDHMYDLGPVCEANIAVGAEPVVIRGEIGCDVPGMLGPMAQSIDTFRGPRYCFQTPPGTTLTVTARGAIDHGVVHARSLPSTVCPAHEPNLGTNVVTGTEYDFETRGCDWSVTYLSTLEGDEYEIELVVQ